MEIIKIFGDKTLDEQDELIVENDEEKGDFET